MTDSPREHPDFRVPPERLARSNEEVWKRLFTEGWCYVGEAARLLDLVGLDYRQLMSIHALVRSVGHAVPSAEAVNARPKGKWSRYTLRDLASASEIARICVQRPTTPDGRARVNVAQLKHACERLQQEGLTNPLLEVHFEWFGGRLIATAQTVRFDAATGQALLDEVAARLRQSGQTRRLDHRLARILREERAAVRAARLRTLDLLVAEKRTT